MLTQQHWCVVDQGGEERRGRRVRRKKRDMRDRWEKRARKRRARKIEGGISLELFAWHALTWNGCDDLSLMPAQDPTVSCVHVASAYALTHLLCDVRTDITHAATRRMCGKARFPLNPLSRFSSRRRSVQSVEDGGLARII